MKKTLLPDHSQSEVIEPLPHRPDEAAAFFLTAKKVQQQFSIACSMHYYYYYYWYYMQFAVCWWSNQGYIARLQSSSRATEDIQKQSFHMLSFSETVILTCASLVMKYYKELELPTRIHTPPPTSQIAGHMISPSVQSDGVE